MSFLLGVGVDIGWVRLQALNSNHSAKLVIQCAVMHTHGHFKMRNIKQALRTLIKLSVLHISRSFVMLITA